MQGEGVGKSWLVYELSCAYRVQGHQLGESLMDSGIWLGIGCFHFGLKKSPPFRFEGSQYIGELRRVLQSISNIDKISVDCEEEFKTLSIDLSEDLPNIQNGPGFFPTPLYMYIEFEVYIPFRIQAQLLGQEVRMLRTFSEKFKISIYHTYDFPVTFVEPLEPSQQATPSQAVRIVREFLDQEFKNSKSEYIRFEYLGPSPFHADCYIQPGKTQGDEEVDWTFRARHLPRRGYGNVVFEFNPTVFAEAADAREPIMAEIVHELGFFYWIRQSEVVKMHDWASILRSVGHLTTIQRMIWMKGFLQGFFVRARLISDAFTAITEFQMKEFDSRHYTQRRYRNLLIDREELDFQTYIDDEIENRITYPSEEVRKLVTFFEGRRAKTVEAVVLLGSAAVAGAMGALLTRFLSN